MPTIVLRENGTWLLTPRSCEKHQSLDRPLCYCTTTLKTNKQDYNKEGKLNFLWKI
jgi:hypothetical protein